jgi:TetR/AcrR family transcriptional regulator, cholesterol catabolism regulator
MDIKDRILQGVRELFWKFGVKSVTMDDIARHLGISKKTIYLYFENKDVLVNEIARNQMEEEERQIQKLAQSSVDPIDEILKITGHIRATFATMNPSLLFEVEKYYPAAWRIYMEHKECCIRESIIVNLRKGIEQGLFRKELNVEIMAVMRMEEVQLAFNPVIFPPSKYSPADVHTQLLDHFMHGICTLKGHKLINKYKQITEED